MREYKDIISVSAEPDDSADIALTQARGPAAEIEPERGQNIDPARTAALLLRNRAIVVDQMRNSPLQIDDISWHILLELVVAADDEMLVNEIDLATRLEVKSTILSRYVAYMIDAGLIEKSDATEDRAQSPLRPTAAGNALSRDILQKVGQAFRSI